MSVARIEDFQPSEPCQCTECQSYCQRPCWPTPQEAMRLMDAGHGKRLMLDWWQGEAVAEGNPVGILCGGLKGHEGKIAPYWPESIEGCTFFVDGLCQLHDTGLKPFQAMVVHHSDTHERVTQLRILIVEAWNSEAGLKAIDRWREITSEKATPW